MTAPNFVSKCSFSGGTTALPGGLIAVLQTLSPDGKSFVASSSVVRRVSFKADTTADGLAGAITDALEVASGNGSYPPALTQFETPTPTAKTTIRIDYTTGTPLHFAVADVSTNPTLANAIAALVTYLKGLPQ